MSGYGFHWSPCSDGQSLGILAAVVVGLVLADQAVQWVAERIWWIGGTLAACYALAVAASMWLAARQDRRDRAWGHARGIYSRADYIAPAPVRAAVAASAPPAIEQHLHLHYHAAPGSPARIVIPGTAGDAIEGKP